MIVGLFRHPEATKTIKRIWGQGKHLASMIIGLSRHPVSVRRFVPVHPHVLALRLSVPSSWCMLQGAEFMFKGSGFMVNDSGFRVQGSGFSFHGS